MRAVWIIACVDASPTIYIATDGGMTYQAHKAKRFDSKAEAEKDMERYKLVDTWQAVSRNLPDDPHP